MPNMDGAEFIRRFRDIPGAEDIPVIVITVYEERSFRLRALEPGATDFLHSPVDHHEFVTRARNLLKMHKHQLLLAARAITLAEELRAARTRVAQFSRAPRAGDRHAAGHDHRDGAGRAHPVRQRVPDRVPGLDPDVVGRMMTKVFGTDTSGRNTALDQHGFRKPARRSRPSRKN